MTHTLYLDCVNQVDCISCLISVHCSGDTGGAIYDGNVTEDLRNVGLDRLYMLRQLICGNAKNRRDTNDEFDNWKGRWMPTRPGDPTPPPKIFAKTEEELIRGPLLPTHRVRMGYSSPDCDDAKVNNYAHVVLVANVRCLFFCCLD